MISAMIFLMKAHINVVPATGKETPLTKIAHFSK
jgi:hypothetical protein